MPRTPRMREPGMYYHLTARGVERRSIFLLTPDYEYYLELVAEFALRLGVGVMAYCLMPNHVHLLIEDCLCKLSEFVQRVHGGYAQKFNWRQTRAGHLFQGRFHAKPIESDRYLTEVFRYIHDNPVQAKLSARPEDYRWSSMAGYLSGRLPDWMRPGFLASLVGQPIEPMAQEQLRADEWGHALGVPWYGNASEEGTAAAVLQDVMCMSGRLEYKDRRILAAITLRRRTRLPLRQIADLLELSSPGSVLNACRKAQERSSQDPIFRALLEKIEQLGSDPTCSN